jgi:hypothetical protein
MTAPKDSPAPAKAEAVAPPSTDVCADCGSDKVVVVTDGLTSERVFFCAKHRPVNLQPNIS